MAGEIGQEKNLGPDFTPAQGTFDRENFKMWMGCAY
jgi:hypothetical protein